MKSGIFKYVFVIFVIGIISYAIYALYYKDKPEQEQLSTKQEVDNIEQITDLRLAVSNFDTINPLITANKEIINIDKIIFEPLISITEDYKIKLNLAKECSKTSDTSYIIKIDNDVKWQDGSSLIAKDIEFTINKLKEGKSIYSYNVENVLNTEIIDDSTIKINLTEPVDFFEYNLTFPILPNNYYIGEDFYNTNKVPIGTGMFSISEITQNNIKLIRNENWWNGEEKPKIDTINIKIYNEVGEIYNSFKLGNIDIFTTYNLNLQEYIGTMGYAKQEVKGREFNYLAFNCQSDLLKNKEIRKAIGYTIDKTNIISSIFNNEHYVSNYPLDYGSYLYNNENLSLGYNPEQAKKLLTDNGWEYINNKWQKTDNYKTTRLNLSLTVDNEDSIRVQVAENIKNQLEQIGINVNINKVSNSRYKQILENKSYEMILTGVYNSFSPDLSSFFGSNNLQNYSNDEINTILSEVKNIQDENLLKEKYQRILEIYNDEQPFISLYRNKVTIIKNQDLIGELVPNNYFSYYRLNTWYRI